MKKAIQTLAVTGAVAALGVTGVVYFGLIEEEARLVAGIRVWLWSPR